jgi:hypothetical protein
MIAKMLVILLLAFSAVAPSARTVGTAPVIEIRDAFPMSLPSGEDDSGRPLSIDSNSPAEWDSDGNLFVFTSSQWPYRSSGASLFELSWPAEPVSIGTRPGVKGGQWIEATFRTDAGVLYGWYHNEPPDVCDDSRVTAPRIGALVSYDDGLSWQDLGIVLEAPPGSLYCDTKNYYFGGGNGDFSVILDQGGQYFYFFISTYHRQVGEQGVAVARMRFEDRDNPAGKIWKWSNGGWNEPGLGGHVTTTFPVVTDWHRENANAFWGPSVHYNTYLDTYVMLLNHAVDRYWSQEGIYISFNDDPEDPMGWSFPQRLPIYDRLGWYPQVIGTDGGETDKLAGQVARLFISGQSSREIVFHRTDGNEDEDLDTPPRPSPKERGAPIIRGALRGQPENLFSGDASRPRSRRLTKNRRGEPIPDSGSGPQPRGKKD